MFMSELAKATSHAYQKLMRDIYARLIDTDLNLSDNDLDTIFTFLTKRLSNYTVEISDITSSDFIKKLEEISTSQNPSVRP